MNNGPFNAWPYCLPLIGIFGYIALLRRDAARCMADMAGYTTKEKAAAVTASLAPYPFMILTTFTPVVSNPAALSAGSLLYAAGLAGVLISVIQYAQAPSREPVTKGIYSLSRNPMYVSALMMFAGIVLMTLDIDLALLLVFVALLQHGMILAEERTCERRFGEAYERYRTRTPRYLLLGCVQGAGTRAVPLVR